MMMKLKCNAKHKVRKAIANEKDSLVVRRLRGDIQSLNETEALGYLSTRTQWGRE